MNKGNWLKVLLGFGIAGLLANMVNIFFWHGLDDLLRVIIIFAGSFSLILISVMIDNLTTHKLTTTQSNINEEVVDDKK